jgi:hypothetical protein
VTVAPNPLSLCSTLYVCFSCCSAVQIGDVVLVHDESGLYEQDLDGRLGFVNPVGLDVRTRAGEFLGKVRQCGMTHLCGV